MEINEYLKRYIELKKQFFAANESPDGVRALYAFKEELEQKLDWVQVFYVIRTQAEGLETLLSHLKPAQGDAALPYK